MRKVFPLSLACWAASIGAAQAGMTVITLTDVAKARLDALSFFIAGYFLISWLVKLVWNHLAKTLTVLPRLDYSRALALVFLSGLMFYVVLTMISGARELLTPGAWQKQGAGYRLREEGLPEISKEERKAAITTLRDEIWKYAKNHDGKAPSSPFDAGVELKYWKFMGGGLYCLMPDVRPGVGRSILVYEPSTAGGRRFLIWSDGTIEDRDEGVLAKEIAEMIRK